MRAIEQALDYGVKVFGVTVHFVDEGVDTGPIILQRAIELPGATDAEESTRRCARSSTTCCPRPCGDRPRGRASRPADPPSSVRSVDGSSSVDIVRAPMEAVGDPARRGPRPPRAALGVRQDAGSSTSRAASPSSASSSSRPAAPPRRCARRASRSARSRTSRASRRSWTAASRRCTRSSTPGCSRVRDDPEHMAAAARARDRVRRPRVREPLPVRAHRRAPRGATEHEVIENIDIGGPTMIRAAAKNHAFAAVVVSPESLRRRAAGAARRRRHAVDGDARVRSRPRRSPTRRATTRRSRAGSPRAPGGLPGR